ncbi:MAG: patatin-like phospholipase family protein, partial [Cyanobacteria bacterium P01_F01_bin.86]
GRLNAVVADSSGQFRRKVPIGRGEIIGEMSVLTNESRSASVYALRDSVLIRYHCQQFKQIIEQYPTLLLRITERLIDRFKQRESGVQSTEQLDRRIAILPHDQDTPLAAFSTQLVCCLSTHGRVLQLNSRYLVESLDFPESMDFSPHAPHRLRFQLWLAKQEEDYDFIIFEADQEDSPWTQFCMGQVDQIVWLTWGEADPSLSLIEQRLQTRQNNVTRLKQTLVLLHPASCKLPAQTPHWLEPRTLDIHHHIRWQCQQDLERLARFLANRAVGVALGGGGGRGAAHIGVLQALKEANIPVDFIGGTSIGGLIAAQYAMGWDLPTMVQKNKEMLATRNPFNAYTIPMISFLSSKKLDRMLQDVYADTQIEDLWLNFFCVSTNISAGEKVVHRRGLVWQANRATIALPGVFVPFIDNGDLLIDGGGLDSDPSLTMGELHTGPIILSSVVPRFVPKVRFTYETVPSAFKIFWSWLNPWSSPIDFPNLADILAMSMGVNSINNYERSFAAADLALTPPLDQYGLFDFEAIDEIIQVAHAYATEQLKTCPPQIPSITSVR